MNKTIGGFVAQVELLGALGFESQLGLPGAKVYWLELFNNNYPAIPIVCGQT